MDGMRKKRRGRMREDEEGEDRLGRGRGREDIEGRESGIGGGGGGGGNSSFPIGVDKRHVIGYLEVRRRLQLPISNARIS